MNHAHGRRIAGHLARLSAYAAKKSLFPNKPPIGLHHILDFSDLLAADSWRGLLRQG